MMDPVPLDKDIVDQFKGKTMAVVGYETDQVIEISTFIFFQDQHSLILGDEDS